MIKRAALAGLVLAASCGTASVAVKPGFDFRRVKRVAVLALADYPRRPGSGAIVAGAFEQELIRVGYDLVERAQVEKIMRERHLSTRNAKELGKLLGVDALLLGNITDFREPREQVTYVDVVDEHQDPIYRRHGDQMTLDGYKTTRVVRRQPQTLTIDGRLGVSARLVAVSDGGVLWSGSDVVRVFAFEDAARSMAESILKAVKPTWPSSLAK